MSQPSRDPVLESWLEGIEEERQRAKHDVRQKIAFAVIIVALGSALFFALTTLIGCAALTKEAPVVATTVETVKPVILQVAQIACLAAVADLGVSDSSMAFSICEIAKEAESAALTEFVALVKGHAMAESARAKMSQPRSVEQ